MNVFADIVFYLACGLGFAIVAMLPIQARRRAVRRTHKWFDKVDGGLATAQRLSLEEFRKIHGQPRKVTFWRGKTMGWMEID